MLTSGFFLHKFTFRRRVYPIIFIVWRLWQVRIYVYRRVARFTAAAAVLPSKDAHAST